MTEQELWARRANSFGASAAAYAEHRPDYPRAAIEWGLAPVPGPVRDLLDLGAGTGKLTGGLVRTGAKVTAVEPDEQMRAELYRLLPDVRVLAGTAEAIPLPDSSMDAAFIGQAMHWFDLDVALTELGRVLRPGGTVVTLWNDEDKSVPWVVELHRITRTAVSRERPATDQLLPAHPDFKAAQHEYFRHALRRTAETTVATIGTHSHVLVAEPAERERVLAAARDYLATRPETAEGEFDVPLITTGSRAVRR